jgi:hypothetical protein
MNHSTLRNRNRRKTKKNYKRKTKKNHKGELFENCSPLVKNKTPVKNSCLIPEILVKIKDEYKKIVNDHIYNIKQINF